MHGFARIRTHTLIIEQAKNKACHFGILVLNSLVKIVLVILIVEYIINFVRGFRAEALCKTIYHVINVTDGQACNLTYGIAEVFNASCYILA